MRAVDSVLKIISVFFEALTRILLAVMVAIIAWLVFARQVLHAAPSWAEEISLVMIIWFGLIGATFGVRERYHLRMDLFFKMMPRWLRIVIAYLTDILIVAFGVLLVIGGIQHIGLTMSQTLPATKLPGAIRYIPLPITGALIAIYGLRNIIGGDTAADVDPKPQQTEKAHVAPEKE
jgi:TRAP-type transport system small permease protein